MFKALLKKRNGNKGFTLIELIVVIAILAILALLLVPRFAGFTDSAKESADKASMETIEKAVLTLMATNELKYSDTVATANTINIPDGAAAITHGATITGTDIPGKLANLIGTDRDAQKGVGFDVSISTAGAITVAIDTTP